MGTSYTARKKAHPMELHVESTSIAHGFTLSVPAPQGGGCGVTVGTG